ncbi:uncharacterized protein PHACADRAFT_259480 [Phanerochaete carnosa HHB-10118-sp]|uniref:Rieske domain-containing protein n=1 Tax=Phanerochaete carnosa (strain HHB-10118-sp) TaxID=650164 RepID=K5WS83_PHACS|nr:uncharacterized protein PHACADRAFT_259480 [Phanerochaete carnosa HHB-10118-sp]EKM53262.1 hypothetical protein PHACADRAFT_259480 [Phanerochaete carnosa HHB-10118-sp]
MAQEFLLVSPLKQLLTHFRYLLTLRSQEGVYHQLILFRLTPSETAIANKISTPEDELSSAESQEVAQQLYAMEAQCPHLGADISHAEIEECDSSLVLVCPWHRYDFDLKTGHSETGLKACTYAVQVRPGGSDPPEERVWVEAPEGGTNWRLVELRPVSEDFADPPPPPPDLSHLSLSSAPEKRSDLPPEPIVPAGNPPKTLIEWAVLILNTADPTLKVQRTRHAVNAFRTGVIKSIGHRSASAPRPPEEPPREEAIIKNTVESRQMSRRKNRAVMLHALANIEQWAIDLAWDIIARFGPSNPDLPHAFFSDFTKMALDESKHFTLLTSRLAALSPATPYGSIPVHAALWESARVTFGSLRSRLAIIHLVHEARGLDVNPGTIAKFAKAGDEESVKMLEIIHADEVTHVTAGHRWFTWLCEREGIDPVKTFRDEVRRGWRGDVKGPFNVEDREKAGMTREFFEDLKGEMSIDPPNTRETAPPRVEVGYGPL